MPIALGYVIFSPDKQGFAFQGGALMIAAYTGLLISMALAGISIGMSITNIIYMWVIFRQITEQANYWRDKVKLLRLNSNYPTRFFSIPIYCASEHFLNRWSKPSTIEDVKLLMISDNQVIIWSKCLFGVDTKLELTPENTRVTWVGRNYKFNLIARWFCLEVNGKKVYVTADFDRFDQLFWWNYKDKTTGLYEKVQRVLTASPVGSGE